MRNFALKAGRLLALVLAFMLLPIDGVVAVAAYAQSAMEIEVSDSVIDLSNVLYGDNFATEEDLARLSEQVGITPAAADFTISVGQQIGALTAGTAGYVQFDVVTGEPQAGPTITPISTINAGGSGQFTIEGYAVGVAQAAGGGNTNTTLFVQDGTNPTDGIQIFGGTGSDLSGYVGQRVRITGTRGVNLTVVQLTGPDIMSLDANPSTFPTPIPVQISDLVGANYRNMLVSIVTAIVYYRPAAGQAPTGGGANNTALLVGHNSQRIELRLAAGAPLPGTVLADAAISVDRAVVSWFNGRNAVQLLHSEVNIPQATPTVTPISTVNAGGSGQFTIEGYAVGVAQAAGGGNTNTTLFVQDGANSTDGIQIFGGTSSDLSGYIGQRVRITGTRGVNLTVVQLTSPTIVVLAANPGTFPTPIPVQMSDLVGANYRNMLVSIADATVYHRPAVGQAPTGGGANNTALLVGHNSQRVELRLVNGSPLPETVLANAVLSVDRAVVSWFNGRSAVQLLHSQATPAPSGASAPLEELLPPESIYPEYPEYEKEPDEYDPVEEYPVEEDEPADEYPAYEYPYEIPSSQLSPAPSPVAFVPGLTTFAIATPVALNSSNPTGEAITLNNILNVQGITMDAATVNATGTTRITIRITNETPGGTFPLSLTIDGVTSTPFNIAIEGVTPLELVNQMPIGARVTVEGYAVSTLGAAGNDARNLWIMDGISPNSGIVLWGGTADSPSPSPDGTLQYLIGERVNATGVIGTSPGGMRQLAVSGAGNSQPVIIGSGDPAPVPLLNTIALASPNYHAMRVSITRAEFWHNSSGLPQGMTGNLPANTHLLICPTGARIELSLAPGEELPVGIETGDWVQVDRAHVGRVVTTGAQGRTATVLNNSAISITTPPLVTDLTITPAPGNIAAGSVVTLETPTADVVIRYSINGGTQQEINDNTANITINEADFDSITYTVVIEAYASLYDDQSNLIESTFPREFVFTWIQVENIIPDRVSGRLAAGSAVRFNTLTEDAEIWYTITINGSTTLAAEYDNETGIVITSAMFAGDATVVITAWGEKLGYRDSEVLELAFTELERGGEGFFFGQLHAHTTMSDGIGTPAQAFAEARDIAGLDFFALSDHSNSFVHGYTFPGSGVRAAVGDGPDVFNLTTYNQTGSLQWDTGNAAALDAMANNHLRDTPFLAENGFEMTWAGGPGHMNTFNTTGWVSRNTSYLNAPNNSLRLQRYYDLLRRSPESVSMFNHPGPTFGNFNNFAHFDPEIALRIPLIEVSNGEGAIGSGGFFPSHEQFTRALDRGWLLAPANSQDNHRGRFGWSNEARVAVYTNDFSMDGLWQAFRDRAAYATEIRDMEITFYVGSEPMGSVIHSVPSLAEFRATVYVPETPRVVNPTITPRDNYTITRMSLITNGGVELEVQNFNVPTGETAFYAVDMPTPEAGYYFLRVVAVNSRGQERIAMTAPIWIGRAPIIGISEVSTETFMPVTTQELTFDVDFFNSENAPVTVTEVQFRVNGNTVTTTNPNLLVLPGQEPSLSFNFTPTNVGNHNVVVRALIEVGGSIRVYYGFADFFVRDITQVGFIGVDASHFNEYVDGGTRNSHTNFARVAGDMNLVTSVFNTEADLLSALANPDYSFIIMSAPSRSAGVVNDPARGEHRSYSDAVVAAAAAFVERGGILALTGFGNFNDTGGTIPGIAGAHSHQQNRLLAAMGSHIRFGDTSHSAPVGFREIDTSAHQHLLNAEINFNLDNPFMQGIVMGQNYRNFSTGALYVVSNPNALILSATDVANYVISGNIPAEVNPMVFAHPASWTLDSNNSAGNQGQGRPKFPAPGANFPRYAHPQLGLAPAPAAGTGAGQRPAGGGTSDGQHLVAASQAIGSGYVLVFASHFFSNFDVRPDLDNWDDLPNANLTIVQNILSFVEPDPVITRISTVRRANLGQWFTVEGVVTSGLQVMGDENRGFMNSIYIQDASGGINLFEVTENNAAGLQVGQRVRATGFVSEFYGETQLTVHLAGGRFTIIDPNPVHQVNPRRFSTRQAIQTTNVGWLAEVRGQVSDIIMQPGTDDILQFTINDGSGPIPVFIRSYITPGVDLDFVIEGEWVSVIGFVSHGELYGGYGSRIRVRDRNEITATEAPPQRPDNDLSSLPGGSGGIGGDTQPPTEELLPPPSEWINPFVDVFETDWFYQAVRIVNEAGLFGGTSANTFSPGMTMTRGMMVTALHRLAKLPAASTNYNFFADVASDIWYSNAVMWAASEGIVNGFGDGTFRPGEEITREQMAVLFFRFAQFADIELPVVREGDFADDDQISEWALAAVVALFEAGVINGRPNGDFDPQGNATRAEVAMLFSNFMAVIEKE